MSAEHQLNIDVIGEAFTDVIQSYLHFLGDVALNMCDDTKNVEAEQVKFDEIRKELFQYLIAHKDFNELVSIKLLSEDNFVLFETSISYSDTCENFLTLEDILMLEERNNQAKIEIFYDVDVAEEAIIERIKTACGKIDITNEDVVQFVDNNFLVDKKDLGTKCSNYNLLRAYVDSRIGIYSNKEKTEQNRMMNEMHSIKENTRERRRNKRNKGNVLDNKQSCGVCLGDLGKGKGFCKLPCNHLCCGNCTKKMFDIQNDNERTKIQCAICNDC